MRHAPRQGATAGELRGAAAAAAMSKVARNRVGHEARDLRTYSLFWVAPLLLRMYAGSRRDDIDPLVLAVKAAAETSRWRRANFPTETGASVTVTV